MPLNSYRLVVPSMLRDVDLSKYIFNIMDTHICTYFTDNFNDSSILWKISTISQPSMEPTSEISYELKKYV